jgi:hypothetical protein
MTERCAPAGSIRAGRSRSKRWPRAERGVVRAWRIAIAAWLAVVAPVVAAAQTRVAGRTVSDTAAPVADVEIAARTAAGAGVVAKAVSDASGGFTLDLPGAGDYLIDAGRPGFYAITGQPFAASPGAALSLTMFPVREHVESLEVTSRGNAVALGGEAGTQALSGAEAMHVPFAGSHDVKNALRTLPGVVQDAFSGIHVAGARESQTLFVMDGFNIGDPLTGGFDPRVSVEAVQSLTVRSGVYSAEFGKGSGGVVEVATSTGGDRLRTSATDFVPTVVDAKGWRVQSWTPRVGLSGPIVRERAWFANHFIGDYNQWFVEELPRDEDSTTSRRLSNHTRTQVNLAPANVLQAGVLLSSGAWRRLGLSALDPLSTTRDADSRQWFVNLRDQQVLANGAVVEAGYASNRTFLRLTPRGHDPWIGTPNGRRGNYYYDGEQRASRDQAIVNVHLPAWTWAGSHHVKIGGDVNRVAYEQRAVRGAIELRDDDDRPIRSIGFSGSGTTTIAAGEAAAFVQDAWTLHPRVVLQLGLRADWDGLTRDWAASPRASIAWAPTAAGDTRVSAGVAVTHDAARLQLFAAARDQVPTSVFAPPYGPGVPVTWRFVVPGGLASPGFITSTAAFDRRLPARLHLHVQGLHRRGDDVAGEITLRQNLGQEYGWLASYTRASARTNMVLGAGPDSYFVAADNEGPLAWDAPHRVLSWAYLPTFRPRWSVSYLLEYRSGFPWSAADSAGFVVGPANAHRFPDYFDLTIGLERRTRLFGQDWAVRASLDNVTNHFNPGTVNGTVESEAFGTFYGGRSRTLAFRVRWLGRAR